MSIRHVVDHVQTARSGTTGGSRRRRLTLLRMRRRRTTSGSDGGRPGDRRPAGVLTPPVVRGVAGGDLRRPVAAGRRRRQTAARTQRMQHADGLGRLVRCAGDALQLREREIVVVAVFHVRLQLPPS